MIAHFTRTIEHVLSNVEWDTVTPLFSRFLSFTEGNTHSNLVLDFNLYLSKAQCKFALIYNPVADSIFLDLSKLHPEYLTAAVMGSVPVLFRDIANIIAYYCMNASVPSCYLCSRVLWEQPISTQRLEVPRLVSSEKRLSCACNNCKQQSHYWCTFKFSREHAIASDSNVEIRESGSDSDADLVQQEACSAGHSCLCRSQCEYCGGPSDHCVMLVCGICNRNVCSVRAFSCTKCGVVCCHTETKSIAQGECSQVINEKYCSSPYMYFRFDTAGEDEDVRFHNIWCFRCVIQLNKCKGCTKYIKECVYPNTTTRSTIENRRWDAQHSLGFHCIDSHCWGCFSKLNVTYFNAKMTHNWCESCQPPIYTQYRAQREERTISLRSHFDALQLDVPIHYRRCQDFIDYGRVITSQDMDKLLQTTAQTKLCYTYCEFNRLKVFYAKAVRTKKQRLPRISDKKVIQFITRGLWGSCRRQPVAWVFPWLRRPPLTESEFQCSHEYMRLFAPIRQYSYS
jgi:hypothetical protein